MSNLLVQPESLVTLPKEKRVIVVDSQKLNTIQTCMRKYRYTFGENIEAVLKPDYFERGELLHHMLQVYYNCRKYRTRWAVNRKSHADVVASAISAGRSKAVRMQLDLEDVEDVIDTFRQYTDFTANDGWDNILAVEQIGSKILFEGNTHIIIYEVKIDLIIRLSNCPIFPIDHKSTQRNAPPNELSNQMLGYCWFLGVQNICVNKIGFQRSLKPEQKFVRQTLSYSQDRIDEWVEDSVFWIQSAMRLIDSNYYPPNLTSCDKYAGCIFRDVCKSDKITREYKLKTLFEQKPTWDPGASL